MPERSHHSLAELAKHINASKPSSDIKINGIASLNELNNRIAVVPLPIIVMPERSYSLAELAKHINASKPSSDIKINGIASLNELNNRHSRCTFTNYRHA